MSTPLEDYALIGDCETAALVSRAGSIDWLCWPRFDSGACFAALLGTPEHGRWLIEAADPDARISRRYRENTLILETRVETADGAVTVIDFMPPRGRNSDIVRLVRGERGRVQMRTELILRFDYGRTVPWVSRFPDGTFRAIAGPDMVMLHTPVRLHGQDLTTVGEFEVTAGDDGAVCPHAWLLPPPAAGRDRSGGVAGAHGGILAGVGSGQPVPRRMGRRGDALADHAEGADLCAHGRDRGGADDVATGAARRIQKLGLSLLLVAGRHADAAGADERGLLRRGAGLARLAAARRRGRPVAAPNHVRTRGRAAPDRVRACPGYPATRARARCGSAMPRTVSCSSMSSGK